MITTHRGEMDEKATKDRLIRYLSHHHAQAVILPVEYPSRRSLLVITSGGKEYDAHIRVSHGQVLVFDSYGQASQFETFVLRKGSVGKVTVGKILRKIMDQGPSLAWLEKTRQDREAKAAQAILAEKEKEAAKVKAKAVAQTKGKVTRVAKTLGLQDRVVMEQVTPDGAIGSVTLTGPWTPAQVNSILRFITTEVKP